MAVKTSSAMLRRFLVGFAVVLYAIGANAPEMQGQRAVRVTDAWLKVSDGSKEAMAIVSVDNGTMYDVYIVGVETDLAGVAELRQVRRGERPAVMKEATVPAFGQLEMSTDGIHIHLAELTRTLKTGETVNLTLTLDNGQALVAATAVK